MQSPPPPPPQPTAHFFLPHLLFKFRPAAPLNPDWWEDRPKIKVRRSQ